MTVYSVYEPPTQAPTLAERAERLAFVKEGFSWIAFLVPILWLLYYRMWVEFILLALVYVALQLAFGTEAQGQALVGWTSIAIAVLFAFEANDLRAASLERARADGCRALVLQRLAHPTGQDRPRARAQP